MSTTKAKRESKYTGSEQVSLISTAREYLYVARDNLSACGSKKAADAVARAIKSADGALRHARRMAP